MKTKLLLVLFLCSTIFVNAQTNIELADKYLKERGELAFTFTANSVAEIQQLAKIISFDHGQDGNNPLTIKAIANNKNFKKFLEFNLPFTVDTELNDPKDVVMFNPKVHKKQAVSAKSTATYPLSFPLTAYPTYDQYASQMAAFAANHPAICELVDIGGTVQGDKRLLFIKLSDNVSTREVEPRVMYTSSMHGNEIAGFPSMLNLIDYFITAYNDTNHADHTRIKNLLDNSEVWINPLANPDATYWLSNDNSTVANSRRENANNVDLNRNYPDNVAGAHPDGEVYQTETLAFMQLANDYHFVISANFHGGTEVVNYPWDNTSNRHPDDDWYFFISKEYAVNCQNNSVVGYMDAMYTNYTWPGVTNGSDWYTVFGGRQDYMNFHKQCKESTVELSNLKVPPSTNTSDNNEIIDIWNYNQEAYIEYLVQGIYGFRGVVKDAVTGDPIKATITLVGHDALGSWVETELPLGDYYRPIKAGTYNILYEADCYQSYTLTDQTIKDYETIDLGDILLTPSIATPTNLNTASVAASTATIGWDNAGVSSYDIQYRVNGASTWIATTSTTNSLNLTGLTANTTYEFQVRSVCGSTYSNYSSLINFTTASVSYCNSSGSVTERGITKVEFNSITQTSLTTNIYQDFTNLSIEVLAGNTYPLKVNLTTTGLNGQKKLYASAFIDFDNNGVFDTTTEKFDLGTVAKDNTDTQSSIAPNINIPITSHVGNVRMRISTKEGGYPTSCETGFDGEVEDYTINIKHTATWTGTTNNNWSTATNWSPAIVPTAASDIVIPSAANISIDANVAVSNLTIGSGAIITVNEGVVLTNTGTITNNGSIVLKSTAAGTAYLLSDSSVANVTQERYLTSNQRGWRILSNPLSTTTFGALASNSLIDLGPSASGAYNSANNTWSSGVDTDNMVTQQGYKVFVRGLASEVSGLNYSVTPPSNVTIKTVGTATNTVPSSITTTAGKYYLVANPYTAPVSVSSILTASSGLSSAVSYYDPSKASNGASELIVKKGGYNANPVSGTSGSASDVVIPPMGTIFVQATTAGSINIPKTAIYTGTISGAAGNYNHKTTNTKNSTSTALTINVISNGVNYDQLQLKFKEVGTTGRNIDFGKLPNTILDFYSITADSKNMAISELELVEQIIPLGIYSKEKQNFTLTIEENSIPSEFEAILEDKLLNTKTILIEGTDYNFNIDNAANSQGEERFTLSLKASSSLVVQDEVLDSAIKIWPNPASSQFNILNKNSNQDTTFEIYTITGRLIEAKKALSGVTTVVETTGWAAGVYILKATSIRNQVIKKLIIE
ncbi:Por secretion system C-terminal sorting domain-containing protein [Lutibacter agarilyticus]|uniref:Por secretion system C-terminal sorting domain-containing protein n=1 Tax=Lutibacter agarilyticus TaxID=1109740 RepID=A0A238W4H5_9FLAO|nr:M14 family zinc carboxypeptidase [Lutibacter agarilyticus]SNR41301.1 Por secretion system C-terminal sorting domain-containing protein [Lutibacter agarilyticus]